MEYFFVITMQHGSRTVTASGVYDALPDATRRDIYNDLRKTVITGLPGATAEGTSVLFFSVEPNQLT